MIFDDRLKDLRRRSTHTRVAFAPPRRGQVEAGQEQLQLGRRQLDAGVSRAPAGISPGIELLEGAGFKSFVPDYEASGSPRSSLTRSRRRLRKSVGPICDSAALSTI
jgi:hypothetical protein